MNTIAVYTHEPGSTEAATRDSWLVGGSLFPAAGHLRVCSLIVAGLGAGFDWLLECFNTRQAKGGIEDYHERIVEWFERVNIFKLPLRTYSSGMHMRLGFSVAIHIKPDILIVDEALAVGDRHFKTKCEKKISHLRDSNKTFLFVSHSPDFVESTSPKPFGSIMVKYEQPDLLRSCCCNVPPPRVKPTSFFECVSLLP